MLRCLAGMVNTVKSILIGYQKKTDYKPEGTEVAESTHVSQVLNPPLYLLVC